MSEELIVRLQQAVATSVIFSSARAIWNGSVRLVQNSYLYRWLTTEPDPEVIVIDLRETMTVGPIISILDWFIERIAPYWQTSNLKQGIDRVTALLALASQTRIGQFLISVFELLAPPESTEYPAQTQAESVDHDDASPPSFEDPRDSDEGADKSNER